MCDRSDMDKGADPFFNLFSYKKQLLICIPSALYPCCISVLGQTVLRVALCTAVLYEMAGLWSKNKEQG